VRHLHAQRGGEAVAGHRPHHHHRH
jgi:hypothetical protein